MNNHFPNRVTNLTVNDMSTDPEIVAALAAYDAKHKGWDRLLAAVTPVADGAHAVADLEEQDPERWDGMS